MIYQAASHEVLLGDQVWELAVDQRALYAIEKSSSRSYFGAIKDFIEDFNSREEHGGRLPRVEPTAILLWGLTASERSKKRRQHLLTEEDREEGLLIPGSFIALLPSNPDEFLAIVFVVFDLFVRAGYMSQKKKEVPLETVTTK